MLAIASGLVYVVLFSLEGRSMGVGAERSGKGCKDDDAAAGGVCGDAAAEEPSFSFRFDAFEGPSEPPFVLRDC